MSTPISLGVERVHRVLGVDERADAAELLGLGEDVVDRASSCPRTPGRRPRRCARAARRRCPSARSSDSAPVGIAFDRDLRALVAHAHDACPCRTGARSGSARPAGRRRGPWRPSPLRWACGADLSGVGASWAVQCRGQSDGTRPYARSCHGSTRVRHKVRLITRESPPGSVSPGPASTPGDRVMSPHAILIALALSAAQAATTTADRPATASPRAQRGRSSGS